MGNEMVERTVIHVLYEHEKSILIVVTEVVSYYIPRLAENHDSYFFFEFLQNFLVLDGYDPDCIFLSWIMSIFCFINSAHAAFAELACKVKLFSWLLWDKLYLLKFGFKLARAQQFSFEFALINFTLVIRDDLYYAGLFLNELC